MSRATVEADRPPASGPSKGRQRLGEVARGDALEVEHGDQDFEALRAPRIRRQERGAEPDAVGAQARAVANPWRANRNRADAGHDLAFGQVAVAHQPLAAFFGARLGVAIKERRHLRLDRPRQQGPGAAAQHLGQRIGKRRWLGKLQNGIVTHGVSLLRWRSGGSITPTIRRLNPSPRHQLLAIALENSNIGVIAFEVAADSALKEGNIVFGKLSGSDVFYQIVDAETFEENFDQNPRGTHIVKAAQLGVYSATNGFMKYHWLPAMNTPIFDVGSGQFDPPVIGNREFSIGKVPSTNIEAVARIDELVEYHTAILGVTGTGKTELALDIVQQAALSGVKTFCVDFTGDYRHRLSGLSPSFLGPTSEQASELERNLFAVDTGEYGAKQEKKTLKLGIDALRDFVNVQINSFLTSDDNLAIFELAEITNTKASLRLTELYLSTIMDWARVHRRQRKVLIVLEEAHTIVPEIFGSGFDADTQFVVSRIGQIALQGRKYGCWAVGGKSTNCPR